MVTCPQCKGVGGSTVKILDKYPWEYQDGEPIEYEWDQCQTCHGNGKISRLEMAIYKARGGPAPPIQVNW